MNTNTPRTDAQTTGNSDPQQDEYEDLLCFTRMLEHELTAVTEQRDELLRYNEAFRKETLICADCDAISKEEYDQAIEQRDRLAEALQKLADCDWVITPRDRMDAVRTIADEALQSLTTNAESIRAGVDSD